MRDFKFHVGDKIGFICAPTESEGEEPVIMVAGMSVLTGVVRGRSIEGRKPLYEVFFEETDANHGYVGYYDESCMLLLESTPLLPNRPSDVAILAKKFEEILNAFGASSMPTG